MTPESDLDVLGVVPAGSDTKAASGKVYRELIGFGIAAGVVVVTEDDLAGYGDQYSLVYYPALREGRQIYPA